MHIPHVMKTNIGSYDAGVRFIGGCTLLFFSVNGLGWWALLGLVPILTAAIGICPLYSLLRVNTARWEEEHESHHPHPPSHHFPE